MKKTALSLLLSLFFACAAQAQGLLPAGWQATPVEAVGVDSIVTFRGRPTIRMEGSGVSIGTYIPRKHEGETYRFSGQIMTDIATGRCVVDLEVRSALSVAGYIHTSTVEFPGKKGWQSFELEMPIVEQVNFCAPFVTINGDGVVWLADLSVTIDGKPLPESGARMPQTIVYPAQSDTLSDGRSGFIVTTKPTRQQIGNLEELCRAWGEMKYTHPAVARGEHNMDAELFHLLPEIWNASPKECRRIIDQWRESFGVYDKSAELPVWHYYFGTAFRNGPAIFRNEIEYPDMDYGDTGMKLLAVFRQWNAVRYFSPCIDLADDQQRVLHRAAEEMFAVDDKVEYQKVLARMGAAMNDSHVSVVDRQSTLIIDRGMFFAPFAARKFIDGKYVVTSVMPVEKELRVGDAITHVDGVAVADFIAEKAQLISASNYPALARDVANQLVVAKEHRPIRLTVERNDRSMDIETATFPYEEFAEIAKNYNEISKEAPIDTIGDDILYINIGKLTVADAPIDDFDKVIVDLRGYPSIDAIPMLSKLMPTTAQVARFNAADQLFPGKFREGEGDYIEGLSTCHERKIVVLVDEQTQSHSEYLTMWLQNNPHVYTLGSQTAGADGNVTSIPMPGGAYMSFTGIGVLYPDGGQTQRVGVRIDETLHRSIESVRNNTDNVVDRAVEILKS